MNLRLLRGDTCVETFPGTGAIPYAAIRESYIKARDFLTNLNGEFSNGVHTVEDIESADDVEAGDHEEEAKARDREVETDEDSSRQSVVTEGEEVEHNYVESLQSFWSKALADKCQYGVKYESQEVEEGEVTVCSIGKLTVEEEDKQAAASAMMNRIEAILEAGQDIVTMIKNGEQETSSAQIRERTPIIESEDDEFETPAVKHAGNYEERVVSDDEEAVPVVSDPFSKAGDSEGLETEMMPGAEYCLGLVRTDKPGESLSYFYKSFDLFLSQSVLCCLTPPTWGPG